MEFLLFFRYGYTNFRYVSSLISGVGIFCVGAGFSWYHGIAGIIHATELVDMKWVRSVVMCRFLGSGNRPLGRVGYGLGIAL